MSRGCQANTSLVRTVGGTSRQDRVTGSNADIRVQLPVYPSRQGARSRYAAQRILDDEDGMKEPSSAERTSL